MVAQAIGMLADAGATYLGDAMSEMIVRLLAEEKVPNVKFNAAWAAGKMGAARVGDIESIRAALTVRAPPPPSFPLSPHSARAGATHVVGQGTCCALLCGVLSAGKLN